MNYNKVKIKVAVKDNPMMQFLTPNLQVYAQLGCPFGCQANKDIDHLIECPRTRNIVKELPTTILQIIQQYVGREIRYFPSFYWVWNRTRYNIRLDMRFHNNDPRLAWFGIVPPGLKGALIEVGVDQRDLQDCIQEIMSTITNNLIDRWKKRCRYLFC